MRKSFAMFEKNIMYFQVDVGTVVGKGIPTGRTVTKKCGGLLHPRTLMGDFVSIESCFGELIRELNTGGFLSSAPTIIVHLIPIVEGGYTEVEIRAFKEAAAGAGAREVILTDDNAKLTDDQIVNRSFRMLADDGR